MTNNDAVIHEFENRKAFRMWLETNHNTSDGIWIVLIKGSKSFTANDALEEAICYGWIDGVIKSIDENNYKKYFSRRKNKENWSEKNRKIYEKLKEAKLVTKAGCDAYTPRDATGNIGVATNDDKTSKNIQTLRDALMTDKEIVSMFENKSPSKQKQFAGFYCDAKGEETKKKRKTKIIEALRSGYDGMLY